jgi:hypothetical protein
MVTKTLSEARNPGPRVRAQTASSPGRSTHNHHRTQIRLRGFINHLIRHTDRFFVTFSRQTAGQRLAAANKLDPVMGLRQVEFLF